MIALVGDVGALYVAYNRLDGAALLAVQSGASALDADAFYGGTIRLDPTEAQRRCREALSAAGVLGDCRAEGGRLITADVRQTVHLPVPLPGVTAPVHVQRSAEPAFGGSSARPGSQE
jgi:hypothetical protein